MSSLKPIILYSHQSGPNPWKVTILMEELGLKYDTKWLEIGNGENGVKGAAFLKIVRVIEADFCRTRTEECQPSPIPMRET